MPLPDTSQTPTMTNAEGLLRRRGGDIVEDVVEAQKLPYWRSEGVLPQLQVTQGVGSVCILPGTADEVSKKDSIGKKGKLSLLCVGSVCVGLLHLGFDLYIAWTAVRSAAEFLEPKT